MKNFYYLVFGLFVLFFITEAPVFGKDKSFDLRQAVISGDIDRTVRPDTAVLNLYQGNGRFGSIISAYYLNDTVELKENIRLFKSDVFDKIAEDGHMPAETRRDANGIWYTYFSLAPMTATAWVAYNATGENLFALHKEGRSVKTAIDYLFYYNQHPQEWTWFKNPVQGTHESKFSDLDLKTNYSFWPANLIEAMSGIFSDNEYIRYVAPYRPLCYEQHHFAWVFTTQMPVTLDGYTKNNLFLNTK